MNKTEIISPSEYGIEERKAQDLMGNLPLIKEERLVLEKQYNEVVLLDIEDKETSKKARELRLKIQKNRTQGINIWHKKAKDFFLKGGQFIDAVRRLEVSVNEQMEKRLKEIEKYAEIQEAKRKEELKTKRVSELETYSEFVPLGIDLGTLSDEEYHKVFKGAKLQYDAKIEEERLAEEERIRIEKIKSLESHRKTELIPYYNFIGSSLDNVLLGEISEAEFEEIKSKLETKRVEHEQEQIRVRKEAEKLAKEKAEAEEKARKEREEYERVLAEKQRKQAELESELKAKKDAEVKAEKERLLSEEKARKEAERLAKAPLKKQMSVWVNSFKINETDINNEKVDLIKNKFEAFKKWALKEVDNL